MEIQSIENIGSDCDITVIMVKKSLKPITDSKAGDGFGKPNLSLTNLATCKQDGQKGSSTDCSLKPLSSWDEDSNDTKSLTVPDLPKTEDLFKISDSKLFDEPLVINTIQNTYTESELTLNSEINNTTFVDINLHDSSENIPKSKIPHNNRKSASKTSLLFSCFSCGPKKRPLKKENLNNNK
jgi:hypothetical protein